MKHFFLLSLVGIVVSCSNDEVPAACKANEVYNQITETCELDLRDPNNGRDFGRTDMGSDDAGNTESDVVETADMFGDLVVADLGNCDEDGDGEKSIACGGLDCDDTDRLKSSTNIEFCDEVDNNCDGAINEGLDCTFYAHSDTDLYKVDPFLLTAVKVSGDLPNIFDIDTHPDGRLFGISSTTLYLFNTNGNTWDIVGEFGQTLSDANGMAIGVDGVAFITGGQTAYTINLTSGRVSRIGRFGGSFRSSGDCVVNKSNTLFMSSSTEQNIDRLVSIDRGNGRATDIGPIGFDNVYALVAGWGNLYGLTSLGDNDGQLIQIDPATGQGTLLHTFPAIQFFGSASDPQR